MSAWRKRCRQIEHGQRKAQSECVQNGVAMETQKSAGSAEPLYMRLASDVDMNEDAELRRLEAGDLFNVEIDS